MISFNATYFDGKSSKAYPVKIWSDGKFVRVRGEQGEPALDVPLPDCTITPALGTSRRSLVFYSGARCESDDYAAVEALERQKGENPGMRLVHYLESRWKITAGCLVGLILFAWLFSLYGIPQIAKTVAYAVPPSLMEKISQNTLAVLDDRYLQPSEIDPQRAAEVRKLFQGLRRDLSPGINYRLVFRKSPKIGANAFALPSGVILVTDELVALAHDDKELVGVLAHEAAHVERRHGLRGVLQDAGVFILISALAGDITSISSTAASLPTLLAESGYSRQFEKEADEAAGRYLIQKGWGTKPYQDILLRLAESSPDQPEFSILATHPLTKERILSIKSLEDSLATARPN